MRILQFSDTHIGPAPDSDYLGVPTRESLSALLAAAKQRHWPPAAILLTGDLTYDGEPEAYAWLRSTLQRLAVPVYCLPGNHDHGERLRTLLPAQSVSLPAQIALGRWHVELLDSTRPAEHRGFLADHVLAALDQRLQEHVDQPVLIALHHHPVPMGSAWIDELNLANAAQFWSVIDRHSQVRAVCWGHVHQAFDGQRKGVRLFACPSTCMQFRPHSPSFTLDDIAPGYRWFDLADDGGIKTGIQRLDYLPGFQK